MKETNHPYIDFKNNIRGDSPIIRGTGIKVIDIVIESQYKGYTPDQIVDYHPHLRLEQVHDALSFYYENQSQIDNEILKEREKVTQMKKEILSNQYQLAE